MSPHADYFNGFDLPQNLVYQTMLDIDSTGISSGQVTYQFLKRRRMFEWIYFNNFQEFFDLFAKSRR
jgi:hypothetical protein